MGGGAESTIDGVFKSDRQRKDGYLVSFGVPINRRQGIKLAYLNVDTRKDLGGSYDSLILGYSVMWGKGL